LGGKQGLSDLLKRIQENHAALFLNTDLLTETKTSFFSDSNYARTVNGVPVESLTTGIQAQSSEAQQLLQQMLSPELFEDKANILASVIKKNGMLNVSLSTVGSLLYSDFNEKNTYLRTDTEQLLTSLSQQISNNYELMETTIRFPTLPISWMFVPQTVTC
jgi:hypothetical protein